MRRAGREAQGNRQAGRRGHMGMYICCGAGAEIMVLCFMHDPRASGCSTLCYA